MSLYPYVITADKLSNALEVLSEDYRESSNVRQH